MLQGRQIALFLDVDNTGLEFEHYQNVMAQLAEVGEIVSATVYNVTDKKHKQIIADAEEHGYTVRRSPVGKRRGKKTFDNRIFVDVVDAVNMAKVIDTVCIVAAPADMLYLYSYLRNRGIKIMACDNVDEKSLALVTEVVDLGMVLEIKPAKTRAKKQSETQPATAAVDINAELDRTDELLKEINDLRSESESNAPSIMDETQRLQEAIDRLNAEQNAAEDESQPESVQQEEVAESAAEQPAQDEAPKASYIPQDDSDLIKKIEELRQNNQGGNPDDLIDEIKKLLDGLE